MENNIKHLVVIGAGPGGYVAAFRAADLGFQVTLIDESGVLGGTCLHKGCIPSKTLLHAARIISEAHEGKDFGIEFPVLNIDLEKLRNKKDAVIQKISSGLKFLCDKRKITFIQARASFLDSQTIQIQKPDGTKESLKFDNAIIATGSKSIELPGFPASKNILDSTSALELKSIPKTLLIIGGGYIGLELGTVYAGLGSTVSVVEMKDQLLPGTDADLVKILERRLKSAFSSIRLNTKVTGVKEILGGFEVTFVDGKGKTETQNFEKILISIGRKVDFTTLELQNTKVQLRNNGFIQVNDCGQTTDPAIYAIGDVTGNPMLAHKASYEGHIVAEALAGKSPTKNTKIIPAVVYTDPEIAVCGLTENQAKAENRNVKVQTYNWLASGRAATIGRSDGLTKFIIDADTEKILGIGIVGINAGDLIMEGALAVELGLKASDLKHLIHPHPSLSETISEGILNFFGENIHSLNK
ncbi:MAG: dihydrolipoyl dehydrogenase [Candidatus Omnitrophica bacterium]|nr:dihydrolipoyl dehydrogenase [Candidatus Omnitrophota bacterium]